MNGTRKALAVVGGGPSAVYSLERLAAAVAAGQLAAPLTVHVYDKGGNFGDGEVHSSRQPVNSFLNRIAGQVSFAADETVVGAGPLLPRAHRVTLDEWCRRQHSLTGDDRYLVTATDWPKRHLHGEALRDHFEQYVATLRGCDEVSVQLHAAEVVDIDGSQSRLRVVCAGSQADVLVDHVLLVTGHSWNGPGRDPRRREKAEFAERTGSMFVGNAYPLERGLTPATAPPGSIVACEGMGLTAIDIILYLTEGRGGQFENAGSNLRYLPSGAEPDLIVPFSGSGLFTFARPDNHKQDDLSLHEHVGSFLTTASVDEIRDARRTDSKTAQLDFERDILPLVLLEMHLVYYSTLFGGDVGRHLVEVVAPVYQAFCRCPPEDASDLARRALSTLVQESDRAATTIDLRLDGVLDLDECRQRAGSWDIGLAVANFVHCVWGEAAPAPLSTVVNAKHPRQYLTRESPHALSHRAIDNKFDWEAAVRPLGLGTWENPEAYRRAMLSWFDLDDRAAAHGNLANPGKAAADGVWRDLRDVLAHAIDRGGLTPNSHRKFLDVYMRHHNRLANGAAREVMAKIRAVAEAGLVDIGVGPFAKVELGTTKYRVKGAATGFQQDADVLIDATVHAFDPRLDEAPLYRNLLARGVVQLWENRGTDGDAFVPGGLDLDENFSPVTSASEPDPRLTVLGPPSEGVVFFQLGALRPEQNHHVMQDILKWIDKLVDEEFIYAHSSHEGVT